MNPLPKRNFLASSLMVILASVSLSAFTIDFTIASSSSEIRDANATAPGSVDTFHAGGSISSLVSDLLLSTTDNETTELGLIREGKPTQIFVLDGNWSLDVVDGEVQHFGSDFVMITSDGNQLHTHSVKNMTNTTSQVSPPAKVETLLTPSSKPIMLSPDNTTTLAGLTDITTNGTAQWSDVLTTVSILNGNVFNLLLNPGDIKHFNGLPIYGTVTSISIYQNNNTKN